MKTVLKSALRARKRTHQKEAARKTLFEIKESKAAQKQKVYMESFARQAKRNERRMRREDWQLGPLAPRYDYGKEEGTFGSSNIQALHQAPVPEHLKIDYPIFVGDRVVVLKGRCKGQIGVVERIEDTRQQAFIKGLNSLDIKLEDYHHEMAGHKRPYQTVEGSVALSDLRLVANVFDKKTGQNKASIVDRVQIHRPHARGPVVRVIAGTGINIGFPQKPAPPAETSHEGDTPRVQVEDSTYIPQLRSAPMPEGVIDELRSKYSRWRKRFEPEFVAYKIAQDEAKARLADPEYNSTRTPLQELLAERKKAEAAESRAELPSEDMLKKMGELLAAKQAAKRAGGKTA